MTYTPVYNDNTGALLGVMVKNDKGSFFVQRERIQRGSAYNAGVNGRHIAGEVDRDIEHMMRDNRAAGL